MLKIKQNLLSATSLFLNNLLDLFFPQKCLGCNRPDTYLCRDCFNKIEISLNNTCFFCGKISWQGKVCLNCQKQFPLDRIISATEYKNPLIREIIKNFKYHYVKELAKPLSQLLIKSLEKHWRFGILFSPTQTENWKFVVIPVPLFKTRVRGRGFNQAELLAQEIANYFDLPLEAGTLKRVRFTTPQVNVKNHEKRKANIKDVFDIGPHSSVEGKIIILVDDVTTTGATLIEAGKVLKGAGANEVWALVVAKG